MYKTIKRKFIKVIFCIYLHISKRLQDKNQEALP